MPNFENFVAFENWQYEVVRHLLQLTVAAFAAGLVYFLATASQVAPRYRLASTISAVVMVSAVLEIGQLYVVWSSGFSYTDGMWRPSNGYLFSNGFRYVNWSIDVPMLLTQLLVVLGLAGRAFWSNWWKLTIAGLLMVWTGYVGQFWEPGVTPGGAGVDASPFWIWGAISTVFFVYLLYKVGMLVGRPPEPLEDDAARNLKYAWWIILFSWTLYPIAYGVLAIWSDGSGLVARQVIFTVADITSKLIFGVVLGRIARLRSKTLGWEPALLVDGEALPPRAPVQSPINRT